MSNASGTKISEQHRMGQLWDYVKIARFDHSTKHILIVPGILLAYHLRGIHVPSLPFSIVLGLVTAVSIASANYVINEWLDRDTDRHHSTKSNRPAVQRTLKGSIVVLEWVGFLLVGTCAAVAASTTMLAIAIVFALQGVVYNVPPLRSKTKAHLDVISESVNNPLRLMIGWAMVDPTTLPPSSIILAFWFGGAFLMAAKRLSEFRQIVASQGKDVLVRYRASFASYTEVSLTVSCFLYALLSSFFIAVFLIKYRVEYILVLPGLAALFARYLALAMKPESFAQKPERLFQERGLMFLVAILAVAFVLTTFISVPFLEIFSNAHFISLR
jgi:4-hydroxybenzoate polyprenyltransferase